MTLSESEKIDALYAKFILGTDPATPSSSAFSAAVFMPTPAAIAAFATKFGFTRDDLTGDNPAQAAVTAKDPALQIPWPRIEPLPVPLELDAVKEYAGMCYRPDGTHAPCSKALLGQWRHVVELLAAPTTDTAAKANKILTGAGDGEPHAVCLALLTGLVSFPGFGSPVYPGFPTSDSVISALTAIPASEPPADISPFAPKPGPSGRK